MNHWWLWSARLGDWALWAQQAAGKAAPQKPAARNEIIPWWIPPLAIAFLFYMVLLRPDRRERSELQKMLQNLKQNDRVVTIGGIYGTVVNASKDSDSVVIRVDDTTNTRLRVLRSAISRVETDEKKEGDKKDAK